MPGFFDPEEFAVQLSEAIGLAREISTRLLLETRPDRFGATPFDAPIFSADFIHDVERFVFIRAAAEHRKALLPVLMFKDGPTFFEPFDLAYALSGPFPMPTREELPGVYASRRVEWVSPPQASRVFQDRLADFIACRLATLALAGWSNHRAFSTSNGDDRDGGEDAGGGGVRLPDSGTPSASGLLTVSVHTRASGLRVHYAPLYTIRSIGTVFGAPTTPVVGPIRPGLWRFGAMGPGQSFIWDPGQFNIPPASSVHLTAV